MRRAPLLLVVLFWMGLAHAAAAQAIDGNRAGVVSRATADSSTDETLPDFRGRKRLRPYAALASFVLPGAGQVLLRNDRFIAYLAVELRAWLQYSKDVSERASQERAYKDLATRFARARFKSALRDTTKFPDADWLYYEWMRDRLESGRFSLTSSGPIVPETDTSTYNGFRWAIALSTQPTYEAALAQYEREAIRPEYQWSWKDAQLQYDIYRRTTDKRNDAARAAVKDLLLIGANHFLSMIDAFATYRLQIIAERGATETRIGASLQW